MFTRLIRVVKGDERRRERRVQVRLPAEIDGVPGRLTDISLGGCGFYADSPGLAPGGEVTARLMPPNQTPFELPARVVGIDGEGMIYCIAFQEVTPEAFERIQKLIVRQTLGPGAADTADDSTS